jgi:hypothetical protein
MKLLMLLTLTFSLNSFAVFDNFKATFSELVLAEASSEFTLEYEVFSQAEYRYNETNRTIQHILAESFTDGLLEMNLKMVDSAQDILNIFGADGSYYGSDFYCYRLVKDFDGDQTKECAAKLEKLIKAAYNSEHASNVSVLKLSGDYYGMWETIFVIVEDYKSNQTLVVEFDLVHEI